MRNNTGVSKHRLGQRDIKPTRVVRRHLAENAVGITQIDTTELNTYIDSYLQNYLTSLNVSAGTFGTDYNMIPFIISADVSNTATSVIFNANVPFKLRIIDAWSISTTGGNSGTWIVDDGTTNVVNAVTWGTGDNDIARAAEIRDATFDIAEGGTIRVVNSVSTDDGIVCIMAIRLL